MKPTLRTVILFALIPMLVALTAFQAWRVHDSIYAVILESFDRKLLAASQSVAAHLDGDLHRARQTFPPDTDLKAEDFGAVFDAEAPYFTTHRDALRELRRQTGLTYLYTQVYLGGDRIYYLLDGTDGDDWTPPGSADTLPDSSIIGVRDAQTFGTLFVTDLLEWDNWGLIKAAYAPIRDREGNIVAMVGADVESTIIRTKTRRALFSVLLIGALTIAVSILVALKISRTLTRPIDEIRDAALGIAAGDRPTKPLRASLREVDLLATTLDRLNRRLEEQQREADGYESRLKSAREAAQPDAPSRFLHTTSPFLSKAPRGPDSSAPRIFALNATPPFDRLPATALLILSEATEERTYKPGHVICPAGFVPDFLHIRVKGDIFDASGRRLPAVAGVGALLSGSPLTEDMVAGPEGCRALVLPRGKFLTLVHERPDLLPALQNPDRPAAP